MPKFNHKEKVAFINWYHEEYKIPKLWDMVQTNPSQQWNWDWLSENPNITFDIVQANPFLPWNWSVLSRNPNITFDIVQANPSLPWDWSALSENPNINFDIVQANPDKEWDWNRLSWNNMLFNDCVFERIYKQEMHKYHKLVSKEMLSHTLICKDLIDMIAAYSLPY